MLLHSVTNWSVPRKVKTTLFVFKLTSKMENEIITMDATAGSICCLNNNIKNVFFAKELEYSGRVNAENFVACPAWKNLLSSKC